MVMKILQKIPNKKFFLNILLPTFLTEALFILLIFAVIVPSFRHNLIEAKKEMIKEIVNSAICIAEAFQEEAALGKISEDEAKRRAVSSLMQIRYGIENKDYLWITDKTPNMIMHPYRQDLIGTNVDGFTDSNGKRMFYEMVKKAEESGEGYVDYEWQWMDDSTRIVPKISYIKELHDWEWIIGTGVYIEDIRESISGVVNSLLLISLGIFALISVLLMRVVIQNLKIEQRRKVAEKHLQESNEKYKALVEASDDGILMFIGERCIFKNEKIDEIINCRNMEKLSADLHNYIPETCGEARAQIQAFLAGEAVSTEIESKLMSRSLDLIPAQISYTRISYFGADSIIVRIKDLSVQESNEVLNILLNDIFSGITQRFQIGVFRAVADKRGKIMEANPVFARLIGRNSQQEGGHIYLMELFQDDEERGRFLRELYVQGAVRDFICVMGEKERAPQKQRISAHLQKAEGQNESYIDGFITEPFQLQELSILERELWESEIARQNLWDLPADSLNLTDIPQCNPEISPEKALELMDFYGTDLLMLHNATLMLDRQSVKTAVCSNHLKNLSPSIHAMAVPVNAIPGKTALKACLFKMLSDNKTHLIVELEKSYKLLNINSLSELEFSLSDLLKKKIHKSQSLQEIIQIQKQLPLTVSAYLKSGCNIQHLNALITDLNDEIARYLIEKAIAISGKPPCAFAFVALGSEGRSEQGLITDQDNAIIYEDGADAGDYFLRLGKLINQLLAEAGYKLCPGEIMAGNPRWNQPLSTWKKYFREWIFTPEPQNVLESVIFFDNRCIFGESRLLEELRQYIHAEIQQSPPFLNQLAMTTVNYKLPVGLFGKIQTESKEDHSQRFHIKNAIRLYVSIIRLYAMKHSLNETNTLERLEKLFSLGHISKSFYDEIKYCYKYLVQVQIKQQSEQYRHGMTMSNYIDLSILTPTELSNLTNVLNSISVLQSKVKYDFGVNF
jgi:signal-transduction protein with cAMP-binding, CBS, and nucleotidyltransferase domain/PAS domain-containing protein